MMAANGHSLVRFQSPDAGIVHQQLHLLEGDVGVGERPALSARLGDDADDPGSFHPCLDGQDEAVQSCLTFNPVEFDGIKTGVVQLFPDAQELDGVPVALCQSKPAFCMMNATGLAHKATIMRHAFMPLRLRIPALMLPALACFTGCARYEPVTQIETIAAMESTADGVRLTLRQGMEAGMPSSGHVDLKPGQSTRFGDGRHVTIHLQYDGMRQGRHRFRVEEIQRPPGLEVDRRVLHLAAVPYIQSPSNSAP